MDLLKKESIAIVGARNCSDLSLQFTDNIAKKSVKNDQIIVSGFAKGIDKKALDSALHYKGESIIVIPQGIETYKSKAYYQEMVKGTVLVMSVYHPKAPWAVGLAMDRNRIIYGLAHDIYVAESNNSGGTWEGALNGLKKGRKVFVRKSGPEEKNANNILIQKGATAVDNHGNELPEVVSELFREKNIEYGKQKSDLKEEASLLEKIIGYLEINKDSGISVSEIKKRFEVNEEISKKLSRLLNNTSKLKKQKTGRYNYYFLNESTSDQGSLF